MREIVFDTETTGLSTAEGHRVFEIGMLELENRLPTGNVFHHFLDPECEISAESTRITGITNADVAGKPKFADIATDLIAFIQDAPLIAHNAGFDMSFLNYELERAGHGTTTNDVVDTLQIARKTLPGARHSLDALCKRFNVTLHGEREYHGALLDARLLAEVYVELTGGLQGSLMELDQTAESATTQHTRTAATLQREPLIIPPSQAEQEAHTKLLEKIEGHLWPSQQSSDS